MSRRNKLLVLVAACFLFLAFTYALVRAREPTYRGKTLAQWAHQYEGDFTPEQAKEASLAIHALCTNSIPSLVEALDYDDTPRTKKFRDGLSWLPVAFRTWLYISLPDRKQLRADAAATALEAMKDEAAPAIPGLTKLAHTTNVMVSYRALWTLSRLGTNGLPALVTAAADPKFPTRHEAFNAIAHMNYLGTNAHVAVPVLVNCTKETDPRVAAAAVRALGWLAVQPEISVPTLANALTNSSTQVRSEAAIALSHFGSQARPAIPALLKALQDKNHGVQMAATGALANIGPEALTNTPAP